MKAYQYFILFFLLLSSCLVIGIVLFNFIVDPFDLYQTPKIEGFNKVKIEVKNQNRLHKAIEIARQKPKAIILGSSQVMGGFNPDDLAMIVRDNAYNAGIASASFEEIYYYFEHALHHQSQLKTIILGIDLFAFSENKKAEEDFSLDRINTLPKLRWKDRLSSLFSPLALKGSYQTVKENILGTARPVFFENGQYNPLFLLSDKNEILSNGDLDFIKQGFSSSELYRHFKLDQSKINLFRRIVLDCQVHGIALKVFICPSKAIYWEALYRHGLGSSLEDFKRQLCAIYPVWDFSGFNSVTTQFLEQSDVPFYFECGHFTPYIGRIILQKMFNHSSSLTDFGSLLTPETVEQNLHHIQQQRTQWLKEHQDIVRDIDLALTAIL